MANCFLCSPRACGRRNQFNWFGVELSCRKMLVWQIILFSQHAFLHGQRLRSGIDGVFHSHNLFRRIYSLSLLCVIQAGIGAFELGYSYICEYCNKCHSFIVANGWAEQQIIQNA